MQRYVRPSDVGDLFSPQHAEPYSAAKLDQLRGEKRPVFVYATAAWCITCLVNEKVALTSTAVADAFAPTRRSQRPLARDSHRRTGPATSSTADGVGCAT